MTISKEMMQALEADAEKLSALTGEDHQVTFPVQPSPRATISELVNAGYRIAKDPDGSWRWGYYPKNFSINWLTSPPFVSEYDAIMSLRAHVEALTEQGV